MDITGGKLFSLLKPFEEEEENWSSSGNLDMYSPLCIYNDTSLLYACTVVVFVVTYNTFLSENSSLLVCELLIIM